MRCSKARKLYFRDRDGLLNERDKMLLQDHISGCNSCLEFSTEMDRCLELVSDLPRQEVSDNFEWNLKRKIAQEKTRIFRSRYGMRESQRWGLKFAASAAAMIIIVFAGAWYLLGRGPVGLDGQNNTGDPVSPQRQASLSGGADEGLMEFTNTGYPAGLRMVSDGLYGYGLDEYNSGNPPLNITQSYRVDYLRKENQLLKDRILRLRRQNATLRRLLSEYSKR